MAVDNKYGRVTLEKGMIGENEPVVVFRATDALLPKMLAFYHYLCIRAGSPRRHLDLILEARDKVLEWQKKNPTRIPNSEASRSWRA